MENLLQEFDKKFCINGDIKDDNGAPMQFADEIKSFLLHAYNLGIQKTQMDFLNAFGEFVPLSGDEAEPKKMAEVVLGIWGEHKYEEGIQKAIEVAEGMRKNSNYPDEKIYNEPRRQEYGYNSALSSLTSSLSQLLTKDK